MRLVNVWTSQGENVLLLFDRLAKPAFALSQLKFRNEHESSWSTLWNNSVTFRGNEACERSQQHYNCWRQCAATVKRVSDYQSSIEFHFRSTQIEGKNIIAPSWSNTSLIEWYWFRSMGDEESGWSSFARTAASVGVGGFRTIVADTPFLWKIRDHWAAFVFDGRSSSPVSQKEAVGAKNRLIPCQFQADVLAPVQFLRWVFPNTLLFLFINDKAIKWLVYSSILPFLTCKTNSTWNVHDDGKMFSISWL